MPDKITLELDAKGNLVSVLKKSEKAVDDFSKKSQKSMFSFKRAFETAAGFVGGAAVIGAFKSLTRVASGLFNTFVTEGVAAANVQENAVNSLNAALQAAGQYSKEASQGIQDFASALQAQTTVGDEAIIQGVALAQTYVKTAEDAKELTKTALDFAAAADLSFTEAIRRLGRGVQGAAGDLANFGEGIRGLTKEQLAAGEATRIIAEEFAGAAASKAATFSGRIDQLTNLFGDLTEEIGGAITENETIKIVIQEVSKIIGELSKEIDTNKKAFQDFVSSGVELAFNALIRMIPAAQFTVNSFLKIAKAVAVVIAGYYGLEAILDKIKRKEYQKGYQEDADAWAKTVISIENAISSVDTGTESLTEALEKIQQKVKEIRDKKKADDEADRGGASETAAAKADADEEEIAALIEKYELMKQADSVRYRDEMAITLKTLQDKKKAKDFYDKANLKNQAKLAGFQKKIDSERTAAGMKALSDLATFQNAKSKEMRTIAKAAAISSTIISTYSGAQKAYEAFAFFPPLAIAAAAAAVAAGLGRVASIAGTPLQSGITEVPQGFPNDSFAARLTSGERVVNVEQNKDLTGFLQDATGIGPRLDTLIAIMASQPAPVVNVGGESIVNALQDEIDSGRALNLWAASLDF